MRHARARAQGSAAAMDLGSNRPLTSPGAVSVETVEMALKVRRELEEAGRDFGPLSVAARMRRYVVAYI